MVKKEHPIARDILNFFENILVLKKVGKYKYAEYSDAWLAQIGLRENYAKESAAAKTTKGLQKFLERKYKNRIKIEAPVAENMNLRFAAEEGLEDQDIDFRKFQAFDILDLETNTAFEISLSDAFAEFFKDVLKAILDSRVKTLYFCARNHKYKGSKKSGYIKVRDSSMIQQYIALARLYKLEIVLFDLFPECNSK